MYASDSVNIVTQLVKGDDLTLRHISTFHQRRDGEETMSCIQLLEKAARQLLVSNQPLHWGEMRLILQA